MTLAAGSRLGAYEIVSAIGAGGMGEVYRARDTRLGRDVALKLLPEAFSRDAERLARFRHEARTAAGLTHPNIVVLYSTEEANGLHFLTMELVEGEPLAQQVAPGGLSVERVVEIGLGLAEALAAAHDSRIVHRDLKPGNVMVTRQGRIKVLDFGLAKAATGDGAQRPDATTVATAPLSAPGEAVGTVPYMAPEQVRGGAVDGRTDLFALGVILYEIATGRRPFTGPTSADVISSILRDAPIPVQTLRSDLPADVAQLIARCLEKDPRLRPQSAREVSTELETMRRQLVPSGSAGRVHEVRPQGRPVPSVAVLPFENHGRGDDDEYFADGMTEDVIAQLCKLRTLKVISRSSVMPFKRRQAGLEEIAASLHVAHVLEGSVRRLGDRVRIVAHLTDAATGAHLWAETFDRNLTDIFTIQSEVALQIATALRAELSPGDDERIRHEPTRDVEAYEHYLRGRHALVRWTTEELLRSIECFERAIARDPGFALAHVGMSVACTELADNGRSDRAQVGARATAAAERAVALDPDLGDAHTALAYALMAFEFDWAGAEREFKRALELSPGSADTYDLYGRLCAGLERFDQAVALQERAYELDPLTHLADLATSLLRAGRAEAAERQARAALAREPRSARLVATLGWALFRQGRVDEGLATLDRAVDLAPVEDAWRAQRAQALALAGRTEEARAVLRELEDPARPVPASPYHLTYIHVGLGDYDRAMDHLERAIDTRSGPAYGIKGSFLLAPLRQHPRFKALLKTMRLD